MSGGWRHTLAALLDEQADDIDKALAELANVHDMLETRDAQELRQFAATLRTAANERRSRARALRAAPADDRRLTPPLTTRHVRGARA